MNGFKDKETEKYVSGLESAKKVGERGRTSNTRHNMWKVPELTPSFVVFVGMSCHVLGGWQWFYGHGHPLGNRRIGHCGDPRLLQERPLRALQEARIRLLRKRNNKTPSF